MLDLQHDFCLSSQSLKSNYVHHSLHCIGDGKHLFDQMVHSVITPPSTTHTQTLCLFCSVSKFISTKNTLYKSKKQNKSQRGHVASFFKCI